LLECDRVAEVAHVLGHHGAVVTEEQRLQQKAAGGVTTYSRFRPQRATEVYLLRADGVQTSLRVEPRHSNSPAACSRNRPTRRQTKRRRAGLVRVRAKAQAKARASRLRARAKVKARAKPRAKPRAGPRARARARARAGVRATQGRPVARAMRRLHSAT
jgi:hypothetical protein